MIPTLIDNFNFWLRPEFSFFVVVALPLSAPFNLLVLCPTFVILRTIQTSTFFPPLQDTQSSNGV